MKKNPYGDVAETYTDSQSHQTSNQKNSQDSMQEAGEMQGQRTKTCYPQQHSCFPSNFLVCSIIKFEQRFPGNELVKTLCDSGANSFGKDADFFQKQHIQVSIFAVEHFQAEQNLFLSVAYIFPLLITLSLLISIH